MKQTSCTIWLVKITGANCGITMGGILDLHAGYTPNAFGACVELQEQASRMNNN